MRLAEFIYVTSTNIIQGFYYREVESNEIIVKFFKTSNRRLINL
jgi:hypothetical protein